MTTIFATLDGSDRFSGFYPDDIWPTPPAGAVAISAAVWQAALASPGGTYAGGVYTPAAITPAHLLGYANGKVERLLATPRLYTPAAGVSIVNDSAPSPTGVYLNALAARLSAIAYPLAWQGDDGTVTAIASPAVLTAFIDAVFAYSDSVWAFVNTVVAPGIAAGTITTPAAIDALAWPA